MGLVQDIGQNGQATVLADGLMQLLWRGARAAGRMRGEGLRARLRLSAP